MAKVWAKSFYASRAWDRCRTGYIQSVGGLCERCLKRDRYVPGKIVHHIEYLTPLNIDDPNVTLSWDNLEYLCQDCHNREHHGEQMAVRDDVYFGEDGELLPR